jgi:hypothetical protein
MVFGTALLLAGALARMRRGTVAPEYGSSP